MDLTPNESNIARILELSGTSMRRQLNRAKLRGLSPRGLAAYWADTYGITSSRTTTASLLSRYEKGEL